jgi:hypothetical protein
MVIDDSPVAATNLIRGTTDDRRDHEPRYACGKDPGPDLLCEMIGFAAQRVMELEVESLTGASYGDKSAERLVQRNGYRDRDWVTGAGTVELRIQAAQGNPTSRSLWNRRFRHFGEQARRGGPRTDLRMWSKSVT